MNESIQATIGLDSTPFQRGLQSIIGKTKAGLGDLSSSVGGKLAGMFGTTALFAGAASLVNKSLDMADSLNRVSKQLDVSTDFLQGFGFAAAQSGSSVETAQAAIEKLAQNIGEARNGSDAAIKKFDALNISLDNTDGTAKSVEQVAMDLADALGKIGDGSIRTAHEIDLLGKSGKELDAIFRDGSKSLSDFIRNAPKLTKDEIQSLDDAGDSLDLLNKRMIIAAGTAAAFWQNTYAKFAGKTELQKRIEDISDSTTEMNKASVKSRENLLELNRLMNGGEVKTAQAAVKMLTPKLSESEQAKVESALKKTAEINKAMQLDKLAGAKLFNQLERDQVQLAVDYANAVEGSVRKAELGLALAQKTKDIEEQRLRMEKDRGDAIQKRADLEKQIADAQRDLNAKQFNKLLPQSVEEIANMDLSRKDPRVRDWWAGQQRLAKAAQDAQSKADEMAQAGVIGGTGGARAWQAAADRLKANLMPLPEEIRDPLRNERERIANMKEQLGALETIIEQNKTGIAVIPVNPPSAK